MKRTRQSTLLLAACLASSSFLSATANGPDSPPSASTAVAPTGQVSSPKSGDTTGSKGAAVADASGQDYTVKEIPAVKNRTIELKEIVAIPAAKPIPAAISGTMELVELKPSNTVNITATQSRTFRTKGKILRVSVSDPSIAEAVVVNEREFILLGKRDGSITLNLWLEPGSQK